jgi:[protein-PII] uridylyltransferase
MSAVPSSPLRRPVQVISAPLPPQGPAPYSVAAMRERFRNGKATLLAHFGESRASTLAATRLTKALTRHVDATLSVLWEHAALPPGAALVAVGGYGRAELFPYSDVDVLVLLPAGPSLDAARGDTAADAPAHTLRASIEAFMHACWDIGLEIGSSVRTVEECVAQAQADVTVQTAMLESRFLCGSRRVYNSFRLATDAVMDPKAFLRAKVLEMRQRM